MWFLANWPRKALKEEGWVCGGTAVSIPKSGMFLWVPEPNSNGCVCRLPHTKKHFSGTSSVSENSVQF